jgi:peroxiredoxin Q/BCP
MLTRLRIAASTAAAVVQGVQGWLGSLGGRADRREVELKVGDEAPEFALAGSDGRTHRLAEYRGRSPVVLAWFPKAFTGGCTAECRSLASNRAALQELNVRYFGISVDTPEITRQFAETMALDFPVLSDPEKAAARAYGVLSPTGFAARWTFYIAADGRIAAIDRQVRAASHGRDVAERLRALKL